MSWYSQHAALEHQGAYRVYTSFNACHPHFALTLYLSSVLYHRGEKDHLVHQVFINAGSKLKYPWKLTFQPPTEHIQGTEFLPLLWLYISTAKLLLLLGNYFMTFSWNQLCPAFWNNKKQVLCNICVISFEEGSWSSLLKVKHIQLLQTLFI